MELIRENLNQQGELYSNIIHSTLEKAQFVESVLDFVSYKAIFQQSSIEHEEHIHCTVQLFIMIQYCNLLTKCQVAGTAMDTFRLLGLISITGLKQDIK